MIILGFDVEEFDMPLEYGKELPFNEQLSISTTGTLTVLEILQEAGIKATFFCTAQYALHQPEIIQKIMADGHEIASHGYFHSDFKTEHLAQSKVLLEKISGQPVTGFRMARMMPVDEQEIANAGYLYNTSLNPTWIPGRYNNLKSPRKWFFDAGLLQIPASVSPRFRFPLFWLTFHNCPMAFIKRIASQAHERDGYLNLYFHPWEFTDLDKPGKYGFPTYVSRNSGEPFVTRIKDFISWAKGKGYVFMRTDEFAKQIIDNKQSA